MTDKPDPVEALASFFVNVRNTHDVLQAHVVERYANAITTLAEELDIDITADGDTLEMELREVFRGKVPSNDAIAKALCCPEGCVRPDDCWKARGPRAQEREEQAKAILALFA